MLACLSLNLIFHTEERYHKGHVQTSLNPFLGSIFQVGELKFLGLVYVVFIPSHSLDMLVSPALHYALLRIPFPPHLA